MTSRKQRMLALVAEHGLRIQPFGNAGAVLVSGPGVYLLADRIESISPADLAPADERRNFSVDS